MSQKPTHNLVMGVEGEDGSFSWRPLGVGWVNERGGVSLKLNECVVLNQREIADRGDLLMLFPATKPPWKEKR